MEPLAILQQLPEPGERRALVTGGTGVVGPELVRVLLANGYRVRVLARHSPERGLLPQGVEVMRGDVTDPQAARAAVQGTEIVFHLAAKLHINNPAHALTGEYRNVNVVGTRVVGEAARTAGVRRVVLFSTIAVYGPTHAGDVVDEDSPAIADSLYAATKREAEAVVLSLRRAHDDAALGVVLRVAGVYGARIKGNYGQLVRGLSRGWFIPVGTGENRRTLVYDRDVAAAALLAGRHPAAAGRIFNVTDGSVHTFREIITVMAGVLGRRPPRLFIPVAAARTVARAADATLKLGGRPRIAGAMLDKMLEDMAVSGNRLQHELGFRPEYDLRTGWELTLPSLLHSIGARCV